MSTSISPAVWNAALRQSLALPTYGMGLKAVCKDPRLVDFRWALEESGSQWSVVQYHAFLSATESERQQIRDEILQYNRDDVMATRALELWLRRLPEDL
jgi:uncharacterized protein